MALPLLLDDLLVGFRRRYRELLGDEEIAGVSRSHFDHLAAGAQIADVFSQYYIHDSFLPLELRRERQQGDVARLLDGVGKAPLVRRAYARNAAGDNFSPLRHEGVKHLDVLIVDVVDLLDAEPAHLFAPEILFLLGGNRLVAAGGTLRRAAWSSFRFRHGLCILRQARKGRAWCWSCCRWVGPRLRQRW